MSSIFLSHSHADKGFVRILARDLRRAGIRVWLDEAELQIGDSLIEKIREGIDQMEYVGAVLSSHSVSSAWVQRELDVAMNQEIAGKRVKVLPILIEDCEIPGFLVGKFYADFRLKDTYYESLGRLLRRLGIEAAATPTDASSLFTLLSGGLARGEEEIVRKALVGFLMLPEGQSRGLVRDVLGSIRSWVDRHGLDERSYEVVAETLVDAATAGEAEGLSAVEYILNMGDYFPRLPRVFAVGLGSPVPPVRLVSNLAMYAFGQYGNTSDAQKVLPDLKDRVSLRIAASYTLGFAGHVEANRVLTEVASTIGKERRELQRAVFLGLDMLSRRSAPSQVIEGLAAIFSSDTVDPEIRRSAARRFIEIEKGLNDWSRRKYAEVRNRAQILAGTDRD